MPLHEFYRMSKQKVDHKEIKISHTLPSSSTIVNFTHFAKPIAIVKANLQNIGLSPSRSESVGLKNKDVTGNNPCKSSKVDLSGECSKKSVIQCRPAVEPSAVDLKHLEPKSPEQDADVSTPVSKDVEKCMAPAQVSSSICSDNGAYRGSKVIM